MIELIPKSNYDISNLIEFSEYGCRCEKHGKIVRFKGKYNIVRHHAGISGAELALFEEYKDALFSYMLAILREGHFGDFVILSYDPAWEPASLVGEKPIDMALKTDDIGILSNVFDKAMEYRAFPILLNSDSSMAIIPTDHLDIFVAFTDALVKLPCPRNDMLEIVEWNA